MRNPYNGIHGHLRCIEEGAMSLSTGPLDLVGLVRDTSRMVCPRDSVVVRTRVDSNHWFGGAPPNFRTL